MQLPFYINNRGKLGAKLPPIAQYLSSPAGRMKLAQSMIQPLRTRLDYQSIGRKAVLVQPLPQGALPTYERDIDVASIVTDDDKTSAIEEEYRFKHDTFVITPRGKLTDRKSWRIFAQRVVIPEFQVFANPTIRISDVKQRRFNLIDRAVQTAKQQLMSREDDSIFDTLEAANLPKVK